MPTFAGIFLDGRENFHPYECGGLNCRHCERRDEAGVEMTAQRYYGHLTVEDVARKVAAL